MPFGIWDAANDKWHHPFDSGRDIRKGIEAIQGLVSTCGAASTGDPDAIGDLAAQAAIAAATEGLGEAAEGVALSGEGAEAAGIAGESTQGADLAAAEDGAIPTYESLLPDAQAQHPKLAGKLHDHHIDLKYMGGDASGPTVEIDAAYHQWITNEFRREWKYGQGPMKSVEARQATMAKVYAKYPLPK
jgi:hypothetical protein